LYIHVKFEVLVYNSLVGVPGFCYSLYKYSLFSTGRVVTESWKRLVL